MGTSTLGAQTKTAASRPRMIWQTGDTIFTVVTKEMKARSPFGPEVANLLPDTIKVLLVGDSGVSLNTPVKTYYSKTRTEFLKTLVQLRSLVRDTTEK
jgi:hypothetical protein